MIIKPTNKHLLKAIKSLLHEYGYTFNNTCLNVKKPHNRSTDLLFEPERYWYIKDDKEVEIYMTNPFEAAKVLNPIDDWDAIEWGIMKKNPQVNGKDVEFEDGGVKIGDLFIDGPTMDIIEARRREG